MAVDSHTLAMLQLALTPGLGPVRAERCIARFGSAEAVLHATRNELKLVRGIGDVLASKIASGLGESATRAEQELHQAEQIGAHFIARGSDSYPPLLAEFDDAPLVLSVRGNLDAHGPDMYSVGIVGSRSCTLYGLEQAKRFGGALARAGLTVISGGAMGIDTASHRGAFEAGGRTIVVLGCGLAHVYPPENRTLFEQIIESGRGAVISELPVRTPPQAENFPARNRIISALSLGVVVIEAGRKSGALITARLATEEHGREVMALPGRVDSDASLGTLELIRDGGAGVVIEPADVVHQLENAARHHFGGSHAARFIDHLKPEEEVGLFGLTEVQRRVLLALTEPRSADELAASLGLESGFLRSELTMLELQRRIARTGGRYVATGR